MKRQLTLTFESDVVGLGMALSLQHHVHEMIESDFVHEDIIAQFLSMDDELQAFIDQTRDSMTSVEGE